MTPFLIILGACVIANTALLSLIYLLLRDALHTLAVQGSQRRQWVKMEQGK